jgi:hypothetical protein
MRADDSDYGVEGADAKFISSGDVQSRAASWGAGSEVRLAFALPCCIFPHTWKYQSITYFRGRWEKSDAHPQRV